MTNYPYWFKGGLLAIPVSIVIVPLSFFIAKLLGTGDEVIWFLAPEFFGASLDLGMRGTPASSQEVTSTITISILIFTFRVFIMGAIIGAIYGVFAKRNNKKAFFIGFTALLLIVLGLISYRTHDILSTYNSVNTSDDCADTLKKGIHNFDENRCYLELATKNQDVTVCDSIQNTSSTEKWADDYKAYCYEEVAHAKKDSSICGLISPETFNEANVPTYRKDRCYGWFNLCEKMGDTHLREQCYTGKAESENDSSICSFVSKNKDKCYSRVGSKNKDVSVCTKVQDPEKRQACYDGVYFYRAREEKNPALCDQIKDEYEKGSCHRGIQQ